MCKGKRKKKTKNYLLLILWLSTKTTESYPNLMGQHTHTLLLFAFVLLRLHTLVRIGAYVPKRLGIQTKARQTKSAYLRCSWTVFETIDSY